MAQPSRKELRLAITNAIDAFAQDPDDVKAREEMLVALRNGKATKLELALIRGALIKEHDQFTFDAAAEEVATHLSTIRPPTRIITAWRDLFQPATNSRNSDVGDDVKAPAVENKSRIIKPTVVSKVTLNLPTCDGSRGEARRWWTDTKDKLEEAHPDANDAAKTTWLMLTKKSLENTCKSGSERVNQLKTEHEMQGGTDVCAPMEEFVSEMDLNSLPALPNEWRAVRQKDSETAIDHRTRCVNPVRDPGCQGCKVTEEQKLAMFKNALLVKAHMQSLDDTKTDTFAKAASEANNKETSNDQNETKGSLNMMNRHGAPETAMHFKTDEKRCGWCKGKDCCTPRCPRKARGLPETTQKRLKDIEKKRKDGRDKQKGAHPRSRRGRLHNVKANEVLAGLLKHLRGEGSANAAPHKTTNSGLTRDEIAQLQSTLGSQSDQDLSSEEIAQVVGCNNASEQIRDLEMPTASEGNEGLKISMARAKMNNRKVTALLDSGSIPLSHIATKKAQELGLSGKANVHRSDHGTAKKGGGFSSMGTLETDVSIPGATVRLPAKLCVTGDMSTNCILGSDFLHAHQAIISHHHGKTFFPRHKTEGKMACLPMLPVGKWKESANASSTDFERNPPAPKEHQERHPNKNLRQIADLLERTPASDDWSMEEGGRCVQALSKRKCKNVTMPRKGPSPDIDPVRMELKEGHENDIVHVPEPSRPQVDHEKTRWQVQKWTNDGKVEPSTSGHDSPLILAKKETFPHFRLAHNLRRVNKMLKRRHFPVRKIDEMLDELTMMKIFTTLDENEACTQIPIHKQSRPLTGFSTRDGKWHFRVFPHGSSMSGDCFSEASFRAYSHDGGALPLWIFVWVHIDDDCMGTVTVAAHVFVLECVFLRLQLFGFTTRAPKSLFLQTEIPWVGHLVSHGKIAPDPAKVEQVRQMGKPKSMADLRSFLAMAGWILKRCATTHAQTAAAFTTACRKPNDKEPFAKVWGEANLDEPCDKLKGMISSESMRNTFNEDAKSTILWTDWSKLGTAAVLTQDGDIVNVWGRSCSPAESGHSPAEGELLASTEGQLRFRRHLPSCRHGFDLCVDHRPLLGICKNHETANEQFANVRSKTEEFDDTRRIRCVPGDEQLADTWSRPFQRPPADFVPDNLHNLFEDDSGFVPDTKESAASVVEAKLKKLRIRRLEDRVEVFTGGEWRTRVPKRQRLRLLCEAHGNDHASDTNMAMRLSKHHWSKKPPDSRQCIQGCKCAALKAAGTPRHESKSSKSSGRICAKERFDVVQIDMCKHSGVWCMTFVDVATGEPWIRRICKVGMAKRNKGFHKAEVHNEHRHWESENGTPEKLHVDNEVAPITLPHPNVQPGPVDRPQSDAMVERLHRVIATLCRVHGTTPDSIRHLLPFFTRPSGGASKKKDDSKTAVKCDGRITKTGTLVRARKPTRSREKEDPFWNKVAKVTERIGKRVHRVWDGERASDRFIDHLKNHSIGDDVLRHAEMNDKTWDVARDTIGAKPDFDTSCDNTDCGFDDDWKNKTVFAGHPGRSNMERLLKKLKRGDCRSVHAAVPGLQCERWFSQLEDLSDSWHAVEVKDEDNFWQDVQGRDFRDEAIDWCLMKFTAA